ncbi:MAG: hypothetical protein IKU19_06440 [Clostridia bacterium]|nr:hypothetical protein [Clostridia bacterium]
MKKLILILLALTMLLCACSKESTPELGGYQSENGYWYLDFDEPTVEVKKEVKVTLSDGTTDTSYLCRPVINVDNEGANQVTKSIKDYLDEKYEKYFKKPDDRIIKVDYETSAANDILTVIITEEIITPEKTSNCVACFHYDDLAGVELNMMEYSNMNGAQLSTVFSAVYESDWAAEYEETTGESPYEDAMLGIVCHGDLLFDVYCLDPDGDSVTKLELQVEDVPLEIPDMEYSYE